MKYPISILLAVSFIMIACQHTKVEYPTSWEVLNGYDKKMAEIIQKYHMPSMAALLIINGETKYSNALGYRAINKTIEVKNTDKYHLGSITKSFTAMLTLILAEDPKVDIGLDSTIFDILYGELEIPEIYRDVTMRQLLSHSGGIQNSLDPDAKEYCYEGNPTDPDQRRAMARDVLNMPRRSEKFYYSNFGYIVAGLMLETAASSGYGKKTTWEDLVRDKIFAPLGMDTAGFGPMAGPDKYDQPWGHVNDKAKALNPSGVSGTPENPPGMASAGYIHVSLQDMEAYIRMLLNLGAPLISEASFKELTTPVAYQDPESPYGLGLYCYSSYLTGELILGHDGTNTKNYATMLVYPENGCALFVATNWGADPGVEGASELKWIFFDVISKYTLSRK